MATSKAAAGRRPKRRGVAVEVRGAKAGTGRLRVAERAQGERSPVGSDAWWRPMLQRKRSFGVLHDIAPLQRVSVVKEGVPAEALNVLAFDMGIAKEKLYATLGVPRATMDRKMRQSKRLNPDESERVVGVARLVGQVEQMVRESGTPEGFDAAKWVAAWLDRPLTALGGLRPGSLMSTAEGRDIVSSLVAQMQSGAYA